MRGQVYTWYKESFSSRFFRRFIRIREQSEDFQYRIRYFSQNGYYKYREKVSGFPTNQGKFGLV